MIKSDTLIDFRDRDQIRRRSPLLIAHRGGVVSSASPENSLAAIQTAALDRYDLVELDIVFAKDGEPVLFHGKEPGQTLAGTSGGDTPIAAWTSQELTQIVYDGSDQRIALLDQALALCQSLGLGIMLDFKPGPDGQLSREGVKRTAALIEEHGLIFSTMVITPYPPTRELLPQDVLFPIEKSDLQWILGGDTGVPRQSIWFDLPENMHDDMIHHARDAGILVIPAINQFRYPDDQDQHQARTDIQRLEVAGVDGYQIDSVYRDAFPSRMQ